MATGKGKTDDSITADVDVTADGESGKPKQRQVPKNMRPLFAEISRLSSTLAIARNAMYDSDPAKSRKALDLLSRQVPQATEIAELLTPSVE